MMGANLWWISTTDARTQTTSKKWQIPIVDHSKIIKYDEHVFEQKSKEDEGVNVRGHRQIIQLINLIKFIMEYELRKMYIEQVN